MLFRSDFWAKLPPDLQMLVTKSMTGVEKEVLYLYFSKGGYLTLDPTIKPKWVDTLKLDHQVLVKENVIGPLDFDNWITESFVRTAYKNLGLDYDAERAKVVDPVKANAGLPMEIWHARDGIKTFATMAEFLKAVADFNATGVRLNATYVYDKETGLKLFGKTAFFVKAANGEFSTFMRKREAEAYAKTVNGTLVTYEQAWSSFSS